MEEYIKEVGIGGVFVIMILREVFNFVKEKKNGSVYQDDNRHITYEEFEKLKTTAQYKDNCFEIVKRLEGEFRAIEFRDTRRVQAVDESFKSIKEDFKEVKTLIKNGNK